MLGAAAAEDDGDSDSFVVRHEAHFTPRRYSAFLERPINAKIISLTSISWWHTA